MKIEELEAQLVQIMVDNDMLGKQNQIDFWEKVEFIALKQQKEQEECY